MTVPGTALSKRQLLERYAPLVPTFELMAELFHILNDARRRRGSIDFDLNEAEVIMDAGGMIEAIIALQRNVAHRIIEEFMLLANETVATFLESILSSDLPRLADFTMKVLPSASRIKPRTVLISRRTCQPSPRLPFWPASSGWASCHSSSPSGLLPSWK